MSALPASDFDVTLFEAFVLESALPAADLDFEAVDLLPSFLDALEEARRPLALVFAILFSPTSYKYTDVFRTECPLP